MVTEKEKKAIKLLVEKLDDVAKSARKIDETFDEAGKPLCEYCFKMKSK
ncbi:MAG: hypothetical protein ACTSX6_14210 [Candidatus Heimdallarchaeaceae archaeon]